MALTLAQHPLQPYKALLLRRFIHWEVVEVSRSTLLRISYILYLRYKLFLDSLGHVHSANFSVSYCDHPRASTALLCYGKGHRPDQLLSHATIESKWYNVAVLQAWSYYLHHVEIPVLRFSIKSIWIQLWYIFFRIRIWRCGFGYAMIKTIGGGKIAAPFIRQIKPKAASPPCYVLEHHYHRSCAME